MADQTNGRKFSYDENVKSRMLKNNFIPYLF